MHGATAKCARCACGAGRCPPPGYGPRLWRQPHPGLWRWLWLWRLCLSDRDRDGDTTGGGAGYSEEVVEEYRTVAAPRRTHRRPAALRLRAPAPRPVHRRRRRRAPPARRRRGGACAVRSAASATCASVQPPPPRRATGKLFPGDRGGPSIGGLPSGQARRAQRFVAGRRDDDQRAGQAARRGAGEMGDQRPRPAFRRRAEHQGARNRRAPRATRSTALTGSPCLT